MKKSEFRTICRNSVGDALMKLLKQQRDGRIEACGVDGNPSDPVGGLDGYDIVREDRDDSEAYILSVRLSPEGVPMLRIYDYYEGEVKDGLSIYSIENIRDVADFALAHGVFEDEDDVSPVALNDIQNRLLDEFIFAAKRLNEAGVSLFWSAETGALAAANRDVMKDCSYWRPRRGEGMPEGTSSLTHDAVPVNDIKVPYLGRGLDLYYYRED